MPKLRVLLVGGSCDGQRRTVNCGDEYIETVDFVSSVEQASAEVAVTPSLGPPVIRELYTLRMLRTAHHKLFYFAVQSLPDIEALRLLIRRYPAADLVRKEDANG